MKYNNQNENIKTDYIDISNVEEILFKIMDIYKNNKAIKIRKLFNYLLEIKKYYFQYKYTYNNIMLLINFLKKFWYLKGQYKHHVEEDLLNILQQYFWNHPFKGNKKKLVLLNSELIEKTNNKNNEQADRILLSLANFAVDMYNFKKDRDSFCSTRRIYSIRILGNILCYYDYPDGFRLIIDTLNKKNRKVLSECFDTLKIYYTNRNIKPNKEIVNKLYEIVENTKMRSIAVGSLDVLVTTSIISELEALSIIDDWKSKNYIDGYS